MPCRKEQYLLLERSVSVSPAEVDALVARIGEALQLHGSSGTHQAVSVSRLHGLTGGGPAGIKPGAVMGGGGAAAAPAQKRAPGSCVRRRTRGHQLRVSPYSVPGADGERRDWEQIRPWSKKRRPVEEDDPHRLLQDLILSGNLIKEAVRRLQFTAADCGDFPRPADGLPC